MKFNNFFDLKGQTLSAITPIPSREEFFSFHQGDKLVGYLQHRQDCCENVDFIKCIGEPADVLNSPITLAETDNPSEDPSWHTPPHSANESFTWSVFILETAKGRVELWFLGESNGYYGESVDFVGVEF